MLTGARTRSRSAAFEAEVDGNAATLIWRTASETRTAGFALQRRADTTADWKEIGFVESKAEDGTTGRPIRHRAEGLGPGTHQFRLRQADLGGSASLTEPIEAQVGMEGTYRLAAYPNPIQRQATIELAAWAGEDLTLRLHDALGRGVATLHDGPVLVEETGTTVLRVEELGPASGAYFLRLRGDRAATPSVWSGKPERP